MSIPAKILAAGVASCSVLLSSCATIITQASRDVSIQSNPSGLSFTVVNSDGETVGAGMTPQTVRLSARGGYFKPAKYTVQVKRSGKVLGTHQVSAGINGWYFGNILIGGLVGMLIVDPLTGAMYRMPKTITVDATSLAGEGPRSLTIASIETLSPEQRATLVRL
ncbi:hypothetical protein [Luteolibacter marinus]|uniref:hypothetical protein n=1 Tax=Luteolibacter marinus TaxID=2776705 RepID=UPI001868D996|nr:hypothetical protein [Luteolibacter marinus]